MKSSLHSKEVTTATVRAVRFSFYADEEVRKLSVKRIVNPIIFDNSKAPVAGGLYDPALGPLDLSERCTTCGLTSDCPGHFGHIELAVPVYNPLVFATLYKLLRCCCLHCFKFRMADKEVKQYILRLSLLLRGDVASAQSVVLKSGEGAVKLEEGESTAELPIGPGDGSSSPTSVMDGPHPSRRDVPMTGHSLEAAIKTMTEVFKRQPNGRCANCGAWSPAIKKEGYGKLFLMPLAPKKAAANRASGTEILPSLFRLQRGDVAAADATVAAAGASGSSSDEEDAVMLDAKALQDFKAHAGDGSDVFASEASDVPRAPRAPPADRREEREGAAAASSQPKFLTPAEVQEVLRCMWDVNSELMELIYPADAGRRAQRTPGAGHGAGVAAAKATMASPAATNYREFFIQTLSVTPNKFRPINHVGDMVYEHPQNTVLAKALNQNLELQRLAREADGAAADGRMLLTWLALQNSVNAFIDSTTAENEPGAVGIRQALEKKEGLFRKNMMGKRVNFAARSVISPDVYLAGGEIGIPPYIAARLTFPERVTPWNVERLCEAVIAGPGKNPGAVAVEDERGRLLMLRPDRGSREAIARRLYSQIHGSTANNAAVLESDGVLSEFGGCKVVYRSMEDGDVLLTNRQPTLHKPGMMAHRARIMRDERTIRFHYANCATFNADFDGDEINLHLPQDQMGRAEGYNIVSADRQFFVPTDGKPLRGLIQDHIVSGTLLTMRDRFFTREQFSQLVYEAVCVDCPGTWDIWMPPPTVLRPRTLWTGKQVVTAVLMHYTRDQLPFSLCTASKVPVDTWGRNSGEGKLRIQHNHLLAGCVDKNCFGKHGLLHFFHELYGPDRTALLTASLSRLFTAFLQTYGFTCGVDDVYLIEAAERERADLLRSADVRCLDAAAGLFGLDQPAAGLVERGGLSYEAAFDAEEPEVREALRERSRHNPATGAALDMKSSSSLHPLSSEVVRACLPGGQVKPFRHNMMALMTVTGAKGSVVNFSQISCLLGQQELEGRRVPRMASGKTLPCFSSFDVCARSGGFVGDRFLTGLRPQEYYFHCMAGREGLVDTTVKTSRSGYIQRCLVKNLEPLRVNYDGTVRDDTDSAIVQFYYGEDGIATTRTGCLRTLPFFFYNMPQLSKRLLAGGVGASGFAAASADAEEHRRWAAREEEADHLLRDAAKALLREHDGAVDKKKSKKGKRKSKEGADGAEPEPLPVNAVVPQTTLGVTSEGFAGALTQSLFGGGLLPPAGADAASKAFKSSLKRLHRARRESAEWAPAPLDPADFARLMQARFQLCQAPPGEAVGVLAAQSIGEPSTQMTLNTFHMAGRGEANVTLGIPRLREILMTASANIATPVMTLPVRADAGAGAGARLAARLRRILLGEALRGIEVEENSLAASGVGAGGRARVVTVALRFHPVTAYPADLGLTFEELANCFRTSFVSKLQQAIKTEVRKASTGNRVAAVSVASFAGEEEAAVGAVPGAGTPARQRPGRDDDVEDGDGVAGAGDGGALDAESEEDEEGKTQFGQGRGEHATYDDGDEDDTNLAAEARREDDDLRELETDDEEEEEEDQIKVGSAAGANSSAASRAWDLEGGVWIDAASSTCKLKLHLALDSPKLLLREVAERVAAATVLRGTPGISKCYVLDGARGGSPAVQTDGINMGAAAAAGDLVEADGIYSNSPAAMLELYGVEACRSSIMREAAAVFGAYGIGVDPRHLALIADYMTHLGGYRPCNRMGISASTSPFLKVTFETAAAFLVSSTLHGDVDRLTSPASRIVVGQPVAVGTGAMDLIQKVAPEPTSEPTL